MVNRRFSPLRIGVITVKCSVVKFQLRFNRVGMVPVWRERNVYDYCA